MGEIIRYRSILYKIEDTIATNPREAKHIHFYYEGQRYRAFFNETSRSFYCKEDEVPRRIAKNSLKLLNDNYDFVEQQYQAVMDGKKVIRIVLG